VRLIATRKIAHYIYYGPDESSHRFHVACCGLLCKGRIHGKQTSQDAQEEGYSNGKTATMKKATETEGYSTASCTWRKHLWNTQK